jgi:pilus assembly protein CpaF
MEMAPPGLEEEVTMSLIERIRQRQLEEQGTQTPGFGQDQNKEGRRQRQKKDNAFNELKAKVHLKLINLLDLARLEEASESALQEDLRRGVEMILAEDNIPLPSPEKERLCREIKHELLGYGPLEPLLVDPSINDILVNRYNRVYVERSGRLEPSLIRFMDNAHLLKIIEKIASGVGRRVDESCPMVDARLPDGSRVNAIIPPLALDGPALSIRKFSRDPITMQNLIDFGSITADMAEVLHGMVRARLNILISGGTGTGKTTFLNVLSSCIPNYERIITIEDSAELQLQQDHVVRLETRPPNLEGQGEVTQRDLVRNALRMRPDRIILGEVRSGEALDMLQAMNTGHDGSLATIHANSPRDALTRLETMVSMAGLNIPDRAIRHQVASAIDVVLQLARLSDGSRKMMNLFEIIGMEGDMITMQEIFAFNLMGLTDDHKVKGRFMATGIRPKFMKRLEASGVKLSSSLFKAIP